MLLRRRAPMVVALLILPIVGVAEPPLLFDRVGDPLPAGAIARLGSARLRHPGPIQALAFAPDGKTLATGGEAQAVCLWDATTGKRLRTWMQDAWSVRRMNFSPDGLLLAVVTAADEIWVWDCRGGELRYRLATHFTATTPGFSADGKWLACRAPNGQIHIREAATGKEHRVLAREEVSASLALSPDGQLVAAGDTYTVRLYDVASGKKLRTYERRSGTFYSVTFAPDGKRLAGGSDSGMVVVWEIESEDPICHFQAPDEARVASLTFAADGKTLDVVTRTGVVRRHDAATGKQLAQFGQPDRKDPLILALAPDGKRLAQAKSRSVRIVDLATERDEPDLGQRTALSRAVWSPVGLRVALETANGELVLWEPTEPGESKRLTQAEGAFTASFAADGTLVAAQSGEQRVTLWSPTTGEEVRVIDVASNRARPLGFSPDGRSLAIEGDNRIVLIDPATGKERLTIPDAPIALPCPGFTPDGRMLAALARGGVLRLRLWETATGRERGRVWLEGGYPIGLAFAPDSTAVATVDRAGLVILYDLAQARVVRRWAAGEPRAASVAYFPSGKILATGRTDGSVWLWEVETGRELHRLAGHTDSVDAVAFSPDGKYLLSASSDTTALVWDVAAVLAARPAVAPTRPRPITELWADLDAADARQSFAAVTGLVERPAEAVTLLKERLRSAIAPEAGRLTKLLADLDSDAFETRDEARKELLSLDRLAGPAIRKALTAGPSPDVKRVLDDLLANLEGPPSTPERLREILAIEALERIGTPEARGLLVALAGGAAEARLTEEARLAVERLKRRAALPR